ncbi:hypothetical protein D3C78_1418160 [compost metagenome]
MGDGCHYLGDLGSQILAVGIECSQSLGLQIGQLPVVLADAIRGQLLAGDHLRQFIAGLDHGGVGVTDLLIQNAQRLGIDDGLANFGGPPTQGGEQFGPNRAHDGFLTRQS